MSEKKVLEVELIDEKDFYSYRTVYEMFTGRFNRCRLEECSKCGNFVDNHFHNCKNSVATKITKLWQ